MISADVERVQDACFFIQATWSTPLMIIGAMVFLWMEVGVSCLAGLAVIMILIPINGFYIGRKIGITQVIIYSIQNMYVIYSFCYYDMVIFCNAVQHNHVFFI